MDKNSAQVYTSGGGIDSQGSVVHPSYGSNDEDESAYQ